MNNLMDNEKIMNFYKDKSLNDKMLRRVTEEKCMYDQ